MTASFTTLPAVDRCLVSRPSNIYRVEALVHNFGDNIDCTIAAFHGEKKLSAIRIGGDCFDVEVQDNPRRYGKIVNGRKIRFTTTEQWIKNWCRNVGG